MLDTKNLRFILPDNDKIYEFLTEDINVYMKRFEVLVTEKFKTKQVRQAKIGNIGVKVENNLLSIDLKDLDIDIKELRSSMEVSKVQIEGKDAFALLRDNGKYSFIAIAFKKDVYFSVYVYIFIIMVSIALMVIFMQLFMLQVVNQVKPFVHVVQPFGVELGLLFG